jgi:hypothetical protein
MTLEKLSIERTVIDMADQNNNQGYVNPIQVQKYLKGVDYPCSKEQLVQKAQEEGADENVIKTLQGMPADNFNSPNDVAQAIGQIE